MQRNARSIRHGRGRKLPRMPSHFHEFLIHLFRSQPELIARLLREVLHLQVPQHTTVRVESADLTDIQPAEYRADLVLVVGEGAAACGIVVEVQLSADSRKRYSWPVYTASLRARLKCLVHLLVVTADDAVAEWAGQCILVGSGHHCTPTVLRLSDVPEVTDEDQARADPELAVLSAMAHGHDPDIQKVLRIARAAQSAAQSLDDERGVMYFDAVVAAIGRAARAVAEEWNMPGFKYEFQSDYARHYIAVGKAEGRAEGKAEGEVEGRAALLLRLVALRFGTLSTDQEARIRNASPVELDSIGERLLTASTLQQVLNAS